MDISWRDAVHTYLPKFECLPSDTPVSKEYSIFVACRTAGFVGEDKTVKLSERLAQDLSRIDILVCVGMKLRQGESSSSDSQASVVTDLPYSLLKGMKDGDSRVITLDGEPVKLTANQKLQGRVAVPTFEEAVSQLQVCGIRYLNDTPPELRLPLDTSVDEVNDTVVSHYMIKGLTQRSARGMQEEILDAPPPRCC